MTSIKSIAEKAGVSKTTVSLILNNKYNNYISRQTREKVQEIAQQHNYATKFRYRLQRGASTRTACILFAEYYVCTEEYILRMHLRLIQKLEESSYSCYSAALASADNLQKIQDLIERGCDSFILIGEHHHPVEVLELLQQHNKSYICYDYSSSPRNVSSDSIYGAEKIITWFLQQGRARFRLLCDTDATPNPFNTRFIALKNIFQDHHEEELVQAYTYPLKPFRGQTDFNQARFQSGYETTRSLLENHPDIQGIFYLSDIFALGGLLYLQEAGLQPGENIAVAGFNYTDAARFSAVPFPSVEHDIAALAEALISGLQQPGSVKVSIKPIVHLANTINHSTEVTNDNY